MRLTPMRPLRIPEAFDHPQFVFEPKIDGFRALAHIQGHRCDLISRNGHAFRSWPQLAEEIAHALRCQSAVIDGEIACLRPDGSPDFYRLLFRRDWPFFVTFDLLFLNGRDFRGRPLLERKRRLRAIMPKVESRVRYLDHVEERGRDLFRVACERDLEGIVGKYAHGTYQSNGRTTLWFKIKHEAYTQAEGRHELFEHRITGPARRRSRSVRPEMRLAEGLKSPLQVSCSR